MRNKFISAILGGALLITATLTPISASAETTYASAGDFIEDVLKTATSNIASSTKETAIDTVVGNITTNGDEVLYEGNSIGYWFSDNSDCLYRDTSKTETLIEDTGNGYAIDSALLSELLTDVNDGFVETYEPTSTDWSKIIGKYDVALGDTVIPMSNWVDFSDKSDDYFVNISRITEITVQNASVADCVAAFSWLVDENGELYISSGVEVMGTSHGNNRIQVIRHSFGNSATASSFYSLEGYEVANDYSWITLKLIKNESTTDVIYVVSKNASLSNTYTHKSDDDSFNAFRNINDPSVIYTETIDDVSSYGVAYYIMEDFNASNDVSSLATEHNNFWTAFETTKTVKGNSTLVKRMSKISNLDDSDVLVISPTGWTVNGTDIDAFLGTQSLTVAGGAVDINATAEVESRNFKVTLPTSLPIFVSRDGTVSTATNAAILNESNDAVAVTDVEINAKSDNDWIYVNTTPSQDIGAKEFSFTTSLNVGDEMEAGASLPFSYNVAFSPEIYNLASLDVATVTITLDWAG